MRLWSKRIRYGSPDREKQPYLSSDGVEQSVHDPLGEPVLLVLVHVDNLPPVRSYLREMKTLAEIHEIEDILLETRSTEPDTGSQEFGANARIEADGMGDFINVGTGGFTDGRQRVDGGDTLGEHGVGRELRKLRGPETHSQDRGGTTMNRRMFSVSPKKNDKKKLTRPSSRRRPRGTSTRSAPLQFEVTRSKRGQA